MRIIAQVVIGYMYKVMKNGFDTSKFRKEFAAIRHGDYSEFLYLIGEEIDFIVSYNSGAINKDTKIREDDSDFGRLLKSGESLRVFFKECLSEYGKVTDNDLSDEEFEKLALFELSLRMHRNNHAKRESHISLEEIINELKPIKELNNSDVNILHEGRRFLNKIKRPMKMKTNWEKEKSVIRQAYSVIERKQLTII